MITKLYRQLRHIFRYPRRFLYMMVGWVGYVCITRFGMRNQYHPSVLSVATCQLWVLEERREFCAKPSDLELYDFLGAIALLHVATGYDAASVVQFIERERITPLFNYAVSKILRCSSFRRAERAWILKQALRGRRVWSPIFYFETQFINNKSKHVKKENNTADSGPWF